jgi:hypothetical protein
MKIHDPPPDAAFAARSAFVRHAMVAGPSGRLPRGAAPPLASLAPHLRPARWRSLGRRLLGSRKSVTRLLPWGPSRRAHGGLRPRSLRSRPISARLAGARSVGVFSVPENLLLVCSPGDRADVVLGGARRAVLDLPRTARRHDRGGRRRPALSGLRRLRDRAPERSATRARHHHRRGPAPHRR